MKKLLLPVFLLHLAACGDNQSNVSPHSDTVSVAAVESNEYLGLTSRQVLGSLAKAVDSEKTEQIETGETATIYMLQKSFAPGFIQVFNPGNPKRTKFTMIVPDDDAVQHKQIGAALEFLGNTVPLLNNYETANRWFAEILSKSINKGSDVAFSTERVGNRKVTVGYAKSLNVITLEVEPD
uniref:ABC transporter periplasmic binding protein n=1 Tax=Siphoviridae sp. ctLeG9 TaxID=2827848 RepID=A0A8S5RVB8_9CAUD|nr:hypothetical protein [uncultured Neisseria sp.]DAF42511.1 MAG TPA: ABC transporter periplasmic binding protein [Siphoviridae sp. ctLeG9]